MSIENLYTGLIRYPDPSFAGLCIICGVKYGTAFKTPMPRAEGRCNCCRERKQVLPPEVFGDPRYPRHEEYLYTRNK